MRPALERDVEAGGQRGERRSGVDGDVRFAAP